MAVVTLTPARALRQPRRLDARALVGLFLLVGATGGSVLFWQQAADTRAVVVATRDLPAGATLTSSDLAIARVRVDDAIYAAAVPADGLETLVGKQLAEPVHPQQLLVQAQLSTRPRLGPDQVALTIPVSAKTAAGGRIRVGDSVRVLVTRDKGKPESRTEVVLPRVVVYDVGRDDQLTVVNTAGAADLSGRPAAQGPVGFLTLAVTPDQSLAVAQARWNGELDVALLPPDAQ